MDAGRQSQRPAGSFDLGPPSARDRRVHRAAGAREHLVEVAVVPDGDEGVVHGRVEQAVRGGRGRKGEVDDRGERRRRGRPRAARAVHRGELAVDTEPRESSLFAGESAPYEIDHTIESALVGSEDGDGGPHRAEGLGAGHVMNHRWS